MIQETQPSPKALVLYDSVFGNTEKIAKALSRGIQRHCGVDCLNIKEANPKKFAEYGLIAIGAPTQAHSAYKPMKDFLSGLEGTENLAGVPGFAFDTKFDMPLSGSAAKYIEKRLEEFGFKIFAPRASAIVSGGMKDNVLRDGEEVRFEKIGDEIGSGLAKLTEIRASE